MKYLPPLFVLLVSCAVSPPPKTPQASAQDCNTAYHSIVAVAVSEVMGPNATPDELDAATIILDQGFHNSGTYDRFIGFCTNHMPLYQVSCIKRANTREQLDICRLITTEEIKHPNRGDNQ